LHLITGHGKFWKQQNVYALVIRLLDVIEMALEIVFQITEFWVNLRHANGDAHVFSLKNQNVLDVPEPTIKQTGCKVNHPAYKRSYGNIKLNKTKIL
jgi:hypothetical protein